MNLKTIVFAGVAASMLALTGCAGNTPNNNNGNETGERISNSINRSIDRFGRNGSNSLWNDNDIHSPGYVNPDGMTGSSRINRGITGNQTNRNSFVTPRAYISPDAGIGNSFGNILNNDDINRGAIGNYNR
jgi:hypothetical protein